jgi:hypothetical protein
MATRSPSRRPLRAARSAHAWRCRQAGPQSGSRSARCSTPTVGRLRMFFAPHLPRQKRVRVFSDHGTWNCKCSRSLCVFFRSLKEAAAQSRGARTRSGSASSLPSSSNAAPPASAFSETPQTSRQWRPLPSRMRRCSCRWMRAPGPQRGSEVSTPRSPLCGFPNSLKEAACRRSARRVLRDCGRARERSDSPLPQWSKSGISAVLCTCVCAGQLTDRGLGQAQPAGEAQQEAGLYLRATTAGPALQRHGEFAHCFSCSDRAACLVLSKRLLWRAGAEVSLVVPTDGAPRTRRQSL